MIFLLQHPPEFAVSRATASCVDLHLQSTRLGGGGGRREGGGSIVGCFDVEVNDHCETISPRI